MRKKGGPEFECLCHLLNKRVIEMSKVSAQLPGAHQYSVKTIVGLIPGLVIPQSVQLACIDYPLDTHAKLMRNGKKVSCQFGVRIMWTSESQRYVYLWAAFLFGDKLKKKQVKTSRNQASRQLITCFLHINRTRGPQAITRGGLVMKAAGQSPDKQHINEQQAARPAR